MQKYWEGRARQVRRRLNAGWWLAVLLPALVAAAALLSISLVAWRVAAWPLSSFWMLFGGVSVVLLAGTGWFAARRFHSKEDALLWLDLEERTEGRLLAAGDGAVPWPDRPAVARGRLSWRWPHIVAPPIAAMLLIGVAGWVPIPKRAPDARPPVAEPIVWSNVADAIEVLDEEDEVADEELVENWREQLEQLKAEAPEKWFEHGNLEASDHLWEGMQDALARMEREISAVERAMEELRDPALQGEARQQAEAALAEALSKIDKNESQMSPALKKALAKIDPKQVPAMSQKQIDELRRKTAIGQEALRRARKAGEDGKNEAGNSGNGEIKRGPGHEPLHFTGDAKNFDVSEMEGLEGHDPERSALGDTIDIDATSHDVDPANFRRTAGGDTKAKGVGGDAVWRSNWLPREQDVLQKYFE